MRRKLAMSTGVIVALGGTALATERIATRALPPAQADVQIAASAPLFAAAGLVGGETLERCTVLTNLGPQPADVTLFGEASESALSPWLPFELVRGTLPSGTPAGDCTGFSPDGADYGAGQPGVVYAGTLATFPDGTAGIADPTRWAAGESHAYLLRVRYTGANAQQGLRTVQDFHWGAVPFDDRAPEATPTPTPDPTPTPTPAPDTGTPTEPDAPAAPLAAPTEPISPVATPPLGIAPAPNGSQCTLVTFGTRGYVGGRAITKPKQIKKKKRSKRKAARSVLGYPAADLLRQGEASSSVSEAELKRRAKLLATTRKRKQRDGKDWTPMLVVRLSPRGTDEVRVKVGLRHGKKVVSPRRWRWVRVRMNSGSTKSKFRYPYTGTAKMAQFKVGYNQIDIALDRGRSDKRIKGLPRVVKRSFAFVVKVKKPKPGTSSSACLLG